MIARFMLFYKPGVTHRAFMGVSNFTPVAGSSLVPFLGYK
jgi:hypothetical protein